MVQLSKRMRFIHNKVHSNTKYNIVEAITILKESSIIKFIESVDVAINLGINARKLDQSMRGIAILPHGIGKNIRVAVFAKDNYVKEAIDVGADLVGIDNISAQIKNGKFNFDVLITSPDEMHAINSLSKFLGPRGFMPSAKLGTITTNVTEAVQKAKKGQIRYRSDKNGIIHATIGKINFEPYKLQENLETLLRVLKKNKPIQAKGIFFKKIVISTTMGIGIIVNQNSLLN